MSAVALLAWPSSRLGEAMDALVRLSGLPQREARVPEYSTPPGSFAAFDQRIGAIASWFEIESESVQVRYSELPDMVRSAGPAILLMPGDDMPFLLVLRGGRRTVTVLDPHLRRQRITVEAVCNALRDEAHKAVESGVQTVLDGAGVAQSRRARARQGLLEAHLAGVVIAGCWMLRLPPGAAFSRQLMRARVPQHLALMIGIHVVQYVLFVLSWWMVGRGALEGNLEGGWLLAWALLLLTLVPLRMLSTWAQGQLAINTSSRLKKRLLGGALRLEPDEIRHMGSGRLLGQVLESEAVESMALGGGFVLVLGGLELIGAAWVLANGAGGAVHLLLLFGWVILTALLMLWVYRARKHWTDARLSLTDALVEGMVGHRTRLAQEPPGAWHTEEDRALSRYVDASAAMDRLTTRWVGPFQRAWVAVGLLGLAPAFVAGASPGSMAVGLGGVLLVGQALGAVSGGLGTLGGALISWGHVRHLFDGAARPAEIGDPAYALGQHSTGREGPVLEAREVVFRYRDKSEPVLQQCTLEIRRGDRILLEGPSGGGKSTLSAVLLGLREPESGLMLLDGLDRRTLGAAAWRRRVVGAPQFHENHVLTGTLAFNLLMGSDWPAPASRIDDAEQVCRDLGLGEVLDRMPAGMQQMVGDTGWQLSHGERSRLFMARALLSGAELLVLDESFAALDPENLRICLEYVLERAPTLLVIAHP